MKAHPLILQLALMLGVVNFVSIMGFTILVLYSQEILGLGAAGHGVLLTAGAAGGVAGGLICPLIVKRLGAQRGIWMAMALFPLPFVALWLTSNPLIVAVALFVEMIGAMQWNVITVSLRQRVITDELLGRGKQPLPLFRLGRDATGCVRRGRVGCLAGTRLGARGGAARCLSDSRTRHGSHVRIWIGAPCACLQPERKKNARHKGRASPTGRFHAIARAQSSGRLSLLRTPNRSDLMNFLRQTCGNYPQSYCTASYSIPSASWK